MRMQTTPRRLALELAAAGRSAYWLAAELGVSVTAVYKWLKGGTMSLDHLQRTAEKLGIPAAQLLCDAPLAELLALSEAMRQLPTGTLAQLQHAVEFIAYGAKTQGDVAAHANLERVRELLARIAAEPDLTTG